MPGNKSFLITPNLEGVFEDRDIPAPSPDEVIVKTKVTGICGSDIHNYLEGKIGYYGFDKPYVPGHESSGIVYAVGKNVTRWKAGDRIIPEPGIPCHTCRYCLEGQYNMCDDYIFMSSSVRDGTFREYFNIREDMLHAMPDTMTFETGALAEPAAVAVHICRRAGDLRGKKIVIFGLGPIGMLVGMTAKAFGADTVTCADINADRLVKAKEYFADDIVNTLETPVAEESGEVIFETAGSPVTVAASFHAAAKHGRIVQVGWLKNNIAQIDTSLMLSKELDYVASYNYCNDFPLAIELLAKHRIDAEKIITTRFPFDQTKEAFDYTIANPKEVLKTLVYFS